MISAWKSFSINNGKAFSSPSALNFETKEKHEVLMELLTFAQIISDILDCSEVIMSAAEKKNRDTWCKRNFFFAIS